MLSFQITGLLCEGTASPFVLKSAWLSYLGICYYNNTYQAQVPIYQQSILKCKYGLILPKDIVSKLMNICKVQVSTRLYCLEDKLQITLRLNFEVIQRCSHLHRYITSKFSCVYKFLVLWQLCGQVIICLYVKVKELCLGPIIQLWVLSNYSLTSTN